ncbi:hypothetical protein [Pseudonocardia spinosispora]|uniref:hypothetical protein n=1 Tax=Pseudonocardia spinosispora TaxID=103441 RepID=UPI0003F94855|nr:hypothetical protein [Pseudonocardia spinosispora]
MATPSSILLRTCLVAGLGLAGCSSPPPGQDAAARAAANAPFCQTYTHAARGARTPIDAMRAQPVLVPFVALIELSARDAAQRASAAPDPAVAGAMREVVASLDDLDAQGQAGLPAGADLAQTPVKLDPTRLASALDTADRTCAGLTR